MKREYVAASIFGFALATISLSGCSQNVIIAEDAIVKSGEKPRLIAYVERKALAVFTKGLPGKPVQFVIDQKEAAGATTDIEGRASATLYLETNSRRFEVRSDCDRHRLFTAANIFWWKPDAPAIAVDLDETVSDTKYFNLIWGDGLISRPVRGAPEALQELSRDYHIVYYSARPRFMLARTRRWLAKYHFPSGPIIFADDFRASFRQAAAKKQLLADLRAKWPNVRIGIGDKHVDVQVCMANGMLPVIVNGSKPVFKENAIVVSGWDGVTHFFRANRSFLSNDRRLAQLLKKEGPAATNQLIRLNN